MGPTPKRIKQSIPLSHTTLPYHSKKNQKKVQYRYDTGKCTSLGEQEQAWACVKRVNVLFDSLVAEAGQLRALHSERRADSYRSYFAWDAAQLDARHREYCGCVCDAHCCNMYQC